MSEPSITMHSPGSMGEDYTLILHGNPARIVLALISGLIDEIRTGTYPGPDDWECHLAD